MKSLVAKLVATFFIIILAASLAILCLCADAQSTTGPQWTIVFRFKPKPLNEPADPDIRIYVLVDGTTEGGAAINAHKALAEKLTAQSADRLEFVESQRKK